MLNNLIPLYLYQGYPIPRPERLYDYVLAEQGIIKRLETRYASADTLLVSIEERLIGLQLKPYPIRPPNLKAPRIPGQLLRDVLADARGNLELEVMYHFRFGSQGWSATRPEQEQSRLRVSYTDHDQANIVLELHSHNTMPAFFSLTDDHDEQGGRFYAVMGHLERPTPELALRLGLYGQWLHNVPALVLFDDPEPFVEVYVEAENEPFYEHRSGWPSFANLFRRRSK